MDVIGDYEYSKKDLIGHGAFAVVYKGRRRDNPNYSVAIKSITKKNLAKSQNLLSKEIKILKELSSLHHENVVQLMDCKETSHHVYLIMEYCNGGDLADYLHAKGTLSEDTIVIFLKQIAGAMLALNAKGVVHRDLKPQNLLLCHTGRSNPSPADIMVKIADFGFARFLNDGVMAATLCGSPMYMAPEVIMSLQYDAKADLWSIGTIVFQCLTGKAPFQAQTPQQLKQFYEKHLDLKPSIPNGTSPELKELLCQLLKRNAKERIDFEDFYNHPFLNPRKEKKSASVPVPVPNRRRASSGSASDSPSVKTVTASPLSGFMPASPPDHHTHHHHHHQQQNEESPETTGYIKVNRDAPSPVEDFVMVPEHLPGDFSDNEYYSPRPNSRASSCSDRSDARSHEPMSTRQSCDDKNSPGRPSSLLVPTPSPGNSPQSEPIPVPTQVQAYHQMSRNSPSSPYCRGDHHSHFSAPGSDASLGRSDDVPIPRKSSFGSGPDIGSISPPSVQFVIGTPPNVGNPWRRSSISGGTPPLSRHAPPIMNSPHRMFDEPDTCSFIPTRGKRSMTEPTELHRYGGTSPGMDREQLLRVAFGPPATSPPTQPYYGRNPSYVFGMRGKDRCGNRRRSGGSPCLDNSPHYARSPPTFDQAAMFVPPELAEETLMDREHNETMSKLNFVLALVECIMELARTRNTPLTESMTQNNKLDTFTLDRISFISEGQRRLEQLVLYVRALQMLSSSLQLARTEVAAGRLQPSSALKTALKTMNKHYHHCLKICKGLQNKGQIPNLNLAQNNGVTAEKLIYSYAIEMCQTAALDELFGNLSECFRRYQQAQILLHSLSQQAAGTSDRVLLDKYKNSVIKRLYNLQNQGFIYSVESSA